MEDIIYAALKNEILSIEGKTVLMKRLFAAAEKINADMPVFLQSKEGQADFLSAVKRFVSEKLISPVGNKPHTHSGLYHKYRVHRDAEKKSEDLAAQIIKSIELPAKVDYYIKHQQDFLDDRWIILAISSFIKNQDGCILTVNERAYELFGDEKFFKGDRRSRGEVVLKRLGLSYADIGCIDTLEPFFSFHRNSLFSRDVRKIFIVENKDTFWSFKSDVLDSASTLEPDMLIYGEGRKIISSFRFVKEYGISPGRDVIYYFGDIDAEGVNIYCDLRKQYPEFTIVPLREAYQAALEIGISHGLEKMHKQQKLVGENIDLFVEFFDEPWAAELRQVLEAGFYVPQEALSAAKIKERFGI